MVTSTLALLVYVGLETEAAGIHVYEAELVHGLLQIPDYYRAFLHTAPAAGTEEEIERKIAVRTARQERRRSPDHLIAKALDPEESRQLFTQVARDLV